MSEIRESKKPPLPSTETINDDNLDQALSRETDNISEFEKAVIERAKIIYQELQHRLLFGKEELAQRLLKEELKRRGISQIQWERLIKITSRPKAPRALKLLVTNIQSKIDRRLTGIELLKESEIISGYAYARAEAEIRAEQSIAEAAEREKAIDPLTGFIRSDEFFMKMYELERERLAKLPNKCLVVIEIDLDDFKRENDAPGSSHVRVDREIIKPLAKQLEQTLRFADIKCRMGGDEFTFVLNDVDPSGVEIVVDKIAQTIRKIKRLSNPQESITASIGYVILHHSEADQSPGALTMRERADQAAYRSKLAGKDRITAWREDLPEIKKDEEFYVRRIRSALAREYGEEVDFLEELITKMAERMAAKSKK